MPIAVITGGNKGLGISQTKRFLTAGYEVFVVSRTKGETETVGATWIEADLARDQGAFLDKIHAKHGPIAVLVNNAGVHLKKPVWEVSGDELQTVLDINVKAMFAACGRYVALHRDTGGAIVNVASMGGIMALPKSAAYVTAKTAVVGLTRSVAVDGAEFGVRCNAVSPGFIDTDMTRAILAKDPARRERIENRIPTHQFGTPENIADAIYFLSNDQSAYINGVNLPIDGGYAIGF